MNKELDILFLGRLFPRENEKEIRNKARVDMQDAANVLQWNLIDGFVENGCKDINVVSYLPVDSWPKHHKQAFIKPVCYTAENGTNFKAVGFCNVTYIKQLLCMGPCKRDVLAWAKQDNHAQKVLVCYSCSNTLMNAAAAAKKADPSILVIQIIADITEFSANDDPKGLRRLYLNMRIQKNRKLEKAIDAYVLLTEQMRGKLGIEKPYMVMEGIVPESEQNGKRVGNETKNILYTGSLNRKYGILELLEAFSLISEPDYRLIVCGLGNAEPEVRESQNKDPRIQYLGKVPHDEVLRLQGTATVLVNPRQNKEEFTKYSFPSKTLEYLASGVPLVGYKLDGIPEEYTPYIHYVPEDGVQALAQALTEVCRLPQKRRDAMGAQAKEFVLRNKNKTVQTGRILRFVREVLREKDR